MRGSLRGHGLASATFSAAASPCPSEEPLLAPAPTNRTCPNATARQLTRSRILSRDIRLHSARRAFNRGDCSCSNRPRSSSTNSVDDDLLKQLNRTASVVAATSLNFSSAKAGQRIATPGQRAVRDCETSARRADLDVEAPAFALSCVEEEAAVARSPVANGAGRTRRCGRAGDGTDGQPV